MYQNEIKKKLWNEQNRLKRDEKKRATGNLFV